MGKVTVDDFLRKLQPDLSIDGKPDASLPTVLPTESSKSQGEDKSQALPRLLDVSARSEKEKTALIKVKKPVERQKRRAKTDLMSAAGVVDTEHVLVKNPTGRRVKRTEKRAQTDVVRKSAPLGDKMGALEEIEQIDGPNACMRSVESAFDDAPTMDVDLVKWWRNEHEKAAEH